MLLMNHDAGSMCTPGYNVRRQHTGVPVLDKSLCGSGPVVGFWLNRFFFGLNFLTPRPTDTLSWVQYWLY
jgi:hypothetical protein